jgi:hypothetical protein
MAKNQISATKRGVPQFQWLRTEAIQGSGLEDAVDFTKKITPPSAAVPSICLL